MASVNDAPRSSESETVKLYNCKYPQLLVVILRLISCLHIDKNICCFSRSIAKEPRVDLHQALRQAHLIQISL